MEQPKLRASRSVSSMPLFVFFEGKRAKTVKYPGIKRIIGRLMMMRTTLFWLRRMRRSPMMLQIKLTMIVFGYLSESSLRICQGDYVFTIFSIVFYVEILG